MFKLVVLCAVVAVASAKPTLLASGLVAPGLVAPGLVSGVVLPSAVSTQSRIDVINPVLKSIASPIVSNIAAAPLLSVSPLASAQLVSNINAPLLSSVAAPLSAAPLLSNIAATPLLNNIAAAPLLSNIAAPAVLAQSELALAPGQPATVLKANGVPLDTADVVINRNNHLVAKSLAAHGIQKRSVVAPVALSSQIISPVQTLSAPLLSAPLLSAQLSPLAPRLIAPQLSPLAPRLVSSQLISSPIVSQYAAQNILPASTIISPAGLVSPLSAQAIGIHAL